MLCQPAICSHSLGRAWVHDFPSKLDQAAKCGLDIELFYEDLLYVARGLAGTVSDITPSPHFLVEAAKTVRSWCDERSLSIMCLQPFMHYEGLRDRTQHAARIEEMKLWIRMAKILGTNVIAIPSTFLSKEATSGDFDLIVDDMREIADLAPDFRFAFEALAWGTWIDTWEASWQVVKAVDRHNFGLCIDTFNLAARVYADPASDTRCNPDAQAAFEASMRRMATEVDVAKIIYVQIADAEYLPEPLREGHEFYDPSQPSRMSWSRNCRLFYGEETRGGYLPVHAILEVLLVEMGYKGWISAEVFHRGLVDPSPQCPSELAARAAESWKKLSQAFDLQSQLEDGVKRRDSGSCLPRSQL